ncbi:hypothetical protein [Halocola ammonii]
MKSILPLFLFVLLSHSALFSQDETPAEESKISIQVSGAYLNYENYTRSGNDFFEFANAAAFVSGYYKINENISAGLKVGYMRYNLDFLPTFISLKSTIIKRPKHEIFLSTGIGYAPKLNQNADRIKSGLCLDLSLNGNIILGDHFSVLYGPMFYLQQFTAPDHSVVQSFASDVQRTESKTAHHIGFTVGAEFRF